MTIQLIPHGSEAYEEMIRLRLEVLLLPIGIPVTYINRGKEKEDYLVAAYDGEEMVGCCVLTPLDKDTLQLRQMAVRARLQGRGTGAAIVRFAEDVARKHGFRTLIMHARDTVLPFYEKCGYVIAGPPFTEVGIGHHRMEKQL